LHRRAWAGQKSFVGISNAEFHGGKHPQFKLAGKGLFYNAYAT
jgi:hypothetical protein